VYRVVEQVKRRSAHFSEDPQQVSKIDLGEPTQVGRYCSWLCVRFAADLGQRALRHLVVWTFIVLISLVGSLPGGYSDVSSADVTLLGVMYPVPVLSLLLLTSIHLFYCHS
jgi:hypothetical protein